MVDSSKYQISSSRSRRPSLSKAQPHRRPSRRPPFPPPPSVEDEIVSLAREHGAPIATCFSDDEPPCKGSVDQQPLLIEVEDPKNLNPERRFVIVNDAPDPFQGSIKGPKEKVSSNRSRNSSFSEGNSKKSKPTVNIIQEPHRNREKSERTIRRRSPVPTKTWPELSPLHTDSRPTRPPEHHRSRSSTSANRPGFFARRQPFTAGDQLLSPDIIHSGISGSDRIYRGTNNIATIGSLSPTRASHNTGHRHRWSRTRSTAGRSESGLDVGKSYRRRQSNEWTSGTSEYKPYSFLNSERNKPHKADEIPPDRTSSNTSRDQSRSYDYKSRSPGSHSNPSKTPLIIQETRRAAPGLDTTNEHRHVDLPKPPLPYPDDDESPMTSLRSNNPDAPQNITISMPVFPMPESPTERLFPEMRQSAARDAAPSDANKWRNTQSLNPAQKEHEVSRPIGAVRRFSESHGQNGQGDLPECPRKRPVKNQIWLTLPRTNLNICPTCYEVFSNSGFGSSFQPKLHDPDQLVSCDFGNGTWYRIAWLLTLKHDKPDLSLLYQSYYVESSTRFESCAGNKEATRKWLTVRDPYSRRPIPGFAVCCECARIVGALLPGIDRVLVPLDPEGKMSRNICAFKFTPNPEKFVWYFDAFEIASDRAVLDNREPDIEELASQLKRLAVDDECQEDSPVSNGFWHTMKYLPELTVCNACFGQVVRPMVDEGNTIALNFHSEPKRLASATCQLYSPRMREIFRKACHRRDPVYLETRVLERRKVEEEIYDRLLRLDRARRNDARVEAEVERLIELWKGWE
ncbi:hypothetical protein CDD82_7142 [Ophiocordyceps australis]|uniref:Uncharacterized protein n=1 Tax=Ophiocordyceps australis TaxID=1399860 RepID=A0A2C5ZRV3_9HYPO|nr:hypothetical protein CDD82_7142 [Ophiocordyceps australis]